jgi:AcrR family transcriptional regulator
MSHVARRQRWGDSQSVDERRDEILRSLGLFLRENRLSSLTMQDIADQLNMTKGNLYYYFRSKQDIIYHGHLKSMERSLAALENVQQKGGSPTAQLRSLIESHIKGMLDDPCAAILMTGIEELAPTQRRRYIGLRDRFERGVRRIIEAGISCGEFRKVDVSLAGFAMLGSVNFVPKWYRPDGRLATTDIAKSFADLFTHALLK